MSNYTIWKKELQFWGTNRVVLPKDAEVLHVAGQHNRICVWFRCIPDDPLHYDERTFAVVGTGVPAPPPSESKYLGTAMIDGGAHVLHVFERIKP